MGAVPVLRRLNQLLLERLGAPFRAEIGNARLSSPGNQRLIWQFTRTTWTGGFPMDAGAKCIAFRRVGLVAEIRVKLATHGLTDADYGRAEEILRNLAVVLDQHCSGDWQVGEEDWSGTSTEPDGAGVVVRLPITLGVKVLDDPWQFSKPTSEPGTGTLSFEGVIKP